MGKALSPAARLNAFYDLIPLLPQAMIGDTLHLCSY